MNRDQLEKCRTYFMSKFDWFDDNQIRAYNKEYECDYLGLDIHSFITETQIEFLDKEQSFFIEFRLISRFKKSSDHNLSMFYYFKKFLFFDSMIRNYTYEDTIKRKDEFKKKNNFWFYPIHAASFIVEPILPSQQLINTL